MKSFIKTLILLLIVLIASSCTENIKKNEVKSKHVIDSTGKEKFLSKINEPWSPKLYTRHQFHDFKSSNCYTMDKVEDIDLKGVQIISLDNRTKLDQFIKYSEQIENLEALQIVHVPLDRNELNRIFLLLSSKKYLRKLILYDCKIKAIPLSINKLKHLETLDLSVNKLRTLPPEIASLQKLSYLRVGANRDFTHFPENICDLPNLEILEFKATSVKKLTESISRCKKLVSLKANAGKLTHIPEELGQCSNLKFINFGSNEIRTVPDGLGNLRNLENLVLSGNRITRIPDSFEHLSNLNTIRLYDNNFTKFPGVLAKIKNLKSIMIQKNRIDHIPDDLQLLKKLYWFCIDEKRIPNSELIKLKEEIPNININKC